MRQVTESVIRYQCNICNKNSNTASMAEECEKRHEKMEKLANSIGSTVEWIIDQGYSAEGKIESVNKEGQYLFAINTQGERIRVGLDGIRGLNKEWFSLNA